MDSVHTDYAKIASVSIVSAIMNCSSPLDVHVITLKENKGESEILGDVREFVKNRDAEIIVHEVGLSDLNIGKDRESYVGTLLRLLLPELIDEDKVIYLDCDLVINMDLTELWNLNLNGKSIAGSVDEGISDTYSPGKIKKIMGAETPYLNAGVLVMDLSKIRKEHKLFDESLDYLDAHTKAVMHDQDALNYLFINDKTVVDRKYNRLASSVSSEEGFDDKIIHFTGKKPWKVIRSDVYEQFWHYFLMMPWMTDPRECWRWTKDVVDNRTLADTLGVHGKIVPMVKMFSKALYTRLMCELGAKK